MGLEGAMHEVKSSAGATPAHEDDPIYLTTRHFDRYALNVLKNLRLGLLWSVVS